MPPPTTGPSFRDRWSSKIGNFSIQYNLGCASLALMIMNTAADLPATDDLPADFPPPPWVKNTLLAMLPLLATVFLGNIVGMLTMGSLGDMVGISKAMAVTTGISLVGALGCALGTGEKEAVYKMFVAYRFVLGIGVGGLYPLSAAQAAAEQEKYGRKGNWEA